jgi:hypothetical protein
LIELLTSKLKTLDGSSDFSLRDKLSKFAIQKGYEPELVWTQIKTLIPG